MHRWGETGGGGASAAAFSSSSGGDRQLESRVAGCRTIDAGVGAVGVDVLVWLGRVLPGRFHPQFRDKNRRDIGKSQPKWTASKMETPGSRRAGVRWEDRRGARRRRGSRWLSTSPRCARPRGRSSRAGRLRPNQRRVRLAVQTKPAATLAGVREGCWLGRGRPAARHIARGWPEGLTWDEAARDPRRPPHASLPVC
eukprot:COSAG01_NODE_2222_length_8137_cov_49.268972_1_plen_197_part_00